MIFVCSERFKRAFQSLLKDFQKKAVRALRLMAGGYVLPFLGGKKGSRLSRHLGGARRYQIPPDFLC
jgi:hypothetical protein